MTFEEFEKIVEESLEGLNSYAYRYMSDGGDVFEIENGFIVQTHIAGGAAGGNCWGDEAQYFTNETPPQDFLPLDKILMAAKPNISYLEYKNIERLIVEGSYGDREYYGNHTNYKTYSLDIRKLYDALFS